MKSLGTGSSEEVTKKLARNVIEMQEEQHKQLMAYKQTEKLFDSVQREKEHLQKEHNKGVLIRFIFFCIYTLYANLIYLFRQR